MTHFVERLRGEALIQEMKERDMDNVVKMNPTQVDPREPAEKRAAQIEAAHKATNAMPVCPHCGVEALYSFRSFEAGPWMAVQIFCGNPGCHKLHNVQITGASNQARQQAVEERPRVVLAHS